MIIDLQYHQSSAIIIIVLNAISFLSLLFVLSIYIYRWKKIASFPLRLVSVSFLYVQTFYLCLSCLAQNLYVLMFNPVLVNRQEVNSTTATSGFCNFEAILKVSSDLSSIIWTTLIIYSTYASVVQKKNLDQAEISYLIIGFIFTIILAVIPVFFKLYGFNTYYCWFDDANRDVEFALKMSYYYLPLWISFFLTVFLSFKVYRTLRDLGLSGKELTFFKRLMLFPLIMLGTAFFSTINLIYTYVARDYPQWLDDLAHISIGFYGILNSIVIFYLKKAYGFNPVIREQILIVFKIKKQAERNETQLSDIQSRYDRNTSRLSEFV